VDLLSRREAPGEGGLCSPDAQDQQVGDHPELADRRRDGERVYGGGLGRDELIAEYEELTSRWPGQ